MQLGGSHYSLVDIVESLAVADSFVVPSNKTGSGNGEKKLYLGHDSAALREFFGPKGFSAQAFMAAEDLLAYLEAAKEEYLKPKAPYRARAAFSTLFSQRREYVRALSGVLPFVISEQTQLEGPRVYVNSTSSNYQLIREIAIPERSYLSVKKLRSQDGKISYYFRLFFKSAGQDVEQLQLVRDIQSIVTNESLNATTRERLIEARVGQGRFRKSILEHCSECPFTGIRDERLLIAGHIKPWKSCNDRERLDPMNGWAFTPTYDRLFDSGLISFDSDKKLRVSSWISSIVARQLHLTNGSEIPGLATAGREDYLRFHRENVFLA